MSQRNASTEELLELTQKALDAARSGSMDELNELLARRDSILDQIEQRGLDPAARAALQEAQELSAKLAMIVGAQLDVARGEIEAASRDRLGLKRYATTSTTGSRHEGIH